MCMCACLHVCLPSFVSICYASSWGRRRSEQPGPTLVPRAPCAIAQVEVAARKEDSSPEREE